MLTLKKNYASVNFKAENKVAYRKQEIVKSLVILKTCLNCLHLQIIVFSYEFPLNLKMYQSSANKVYGKFARCTVTSFQHFQRSCDKTTQK